MTQILSVQDLAIRYGENAIVEQISLELASGRCLGIVGESGSGKSQLGLALMGLLPSSAQQVGQIQLSGKACEPSERRDLMAMVFQDPQSALTPHMRVGSQVAEATDQIIEPYLRKAGLPDTQRVARSYPHQLSGGMRQRAMLAMALAREPQVLIADEPTTALDATVQMDLLKQFAQLKAAGQALIFISHDIGAIAGLADDIMVMQQGKCVEYGAAADVISAPKHSYTQELLKAGNLSNHHRAAKTRSDALIETRAVSKNYGAFTALHPTDLHLGSGETLAIVGESGSGKSTLAKLVLGLETPTDGQIVWDSSALRDMSAKSLRQKRLQIQPVFQDPFASFDPQRTLGRSIQDALDLSGSAITIESLFADVNLPHALAGRYPHQVSGGQNQRAAIARALACNPKVLVCDEALSALDKTTQARVLDLLASLKQKRGLSLLFISHDLHVVRHIADRVMILKEGQLVEEGGVRDVYDTPKTDYTRQLLAAQTVADVSEMRRRLSAPAIA